MRVKFTIAVCALLVLALGASQAYAQDGYSVSRNINTVVEHGKNQMMGDIELVYTANGGNIDAGNTVTVTFGALSLSSDGELVCRAAADVALVACGTDYDLSFENDEDTDVGTVTITIPDTIVAGDVIRLRGVRADVSGLAAEDSVIATISTSPPGGLIPVDQVEKGSVATSVAVVKAGLVVVIDAASRLICNLDATYDADGDPATADDNETPVGGVPMITVSEVFDDAWETVLGGTVITIATLNLPAGVELRWPASVTFTDPDDETVVWATLTLSGDAATQAVVDETLEDNDNDGSEVTYAYTIQNVDGAGGEMDSFAIPITIVTGDIASGAGGIANISAFLSPVAADDTNLETTLAYVMNAVTDPETDEGDFLNIADCVTYLLFPYITCGAHADWDTGIAIANTTMDDGIFGLSTGATAQRGTITMYAFPTGVKTPNNATDMGYTGEPTMTMLSGGLAAGDSIAMTCSSNDALAGMQGYAIVKAGFRHAHGMAFVTNSASGAIDAVHGYVALVIPDPEFGGKNEDRAAAEGEVLGH